MSRLSKVEWPGYDALMARLNAAGNLSYEQVRPLLEEYERILIEDNRKGVLAGTDGEGKPLKAVTYRGGAGKATYARRGQAFGSASGTPKGRRFGKVAQGEPHANGNLTTAEYRKLTGPPLAPRGEQSRVIANVVTSSGQDGSGKFFVKRGWKQVVSRKGVPFLSAHFKGKGHLPVRDLRGLRPWGREKCKDAMRTFAKYLLARK